MRSHPKLVNGTAFEPDKREATAGQKGEVYQQ